MHVVLVTRIPPVVTVAAWLLVPLSRLICLVLLLLVLVASTVNGTTFTVIVCGSLCSLLSPAVLSQSVFFGSVFSPHPPAFDIFVGDT